MLPQERGLQALNEQLSLLIELQKLDSAILAKNREVKAMPELMTSAEAPMNEALEALEGQRRKHEASEKKKRQKEGELAELDERIKKLKARTSDIKDNKAYQAHLKEIESVEKTRYSMEDEILLLMEAVDKEKAEIKVAESALKAETLKTDALRREIEGRVAEAEKELGVLKAQRKTHSSSVEPDLYNEYMNLLRGRKGLAVVEARAGVCLGCNMNIMPQLFVEIKRNEGIIHCPQCRRILYHSEQPESPPSL